MKITCYTCWIEAMERQKVMTTWKASVISTYFSHSELSVCVP